MGVTAIIGLQWGDEGKGKVVDVLCERADYVVRCQGGSNAGHTVVTGGRTFILHLVPSGILRENVVCAIASGVAVDLDELARELDELRRAGIETADRLLLSNKAHVVLPHHKRLDGAEETSRGDTKIGTTMRGIGPCYADKYARFGIRVGDLLDGPELEKRIVASARAHAGGCGGKPVFDADEVRAYCRTHRDLVAELSWDTTSILLDAAGAGKEVVLEGAQGFLLDIDHGTYPFVTSSNTGVHGLITGSGLPASCIDSVVGVLKAYVTRVGEGPLPTEMEEPYQARVREKGGEFGATTGRPRRCGWLDLVALRYACALNGVTSLALTKLDILSGLDRLQICASYEHDGRTLDSFPSESGFLAQCRPCYTRQEPWPDLGDAKRVDDLPGAAAAYVELVAGAAEAPVELVSVGPGRGATLRVQD
jgi:adenylosuccinate synthase